MTRKDYELIAKALKSALADAGPGFSAGGVELAAKYLAIELVCDNPRFDQTRFLLACGVA